MCIRDSAKLKERLDRGEDLPQYIKDHPIYYAGPAKTPEGMACGSMGPTTAGRMDPYVDLFQSHGGSMIMLAKGNRSQQVTDEMCIRDRFGPFLKMPVTLLKKCTRNIHTNAILIRSIIFMQFIKREILNSGLNMVKERSRKMN